ncbi:MAG TPA: 4-(cytidine 5'-diphospho)-2-C-methyl-D-erythritol kinase [Fibrobacteria bacterium]|nr:4-(cytidine 5'-diphospho)-2-C-methyl-D-erythritol kinase [Fibrobacteria bacterium]
MTRSAETVPCFGKINLFLEIQDRRSDGYHNLGTLFHTIDCGDRLSAEAAETLTLDCAEGITATPDDNLVIKAAKLLRATFPDRVKADVGMRFSLAKILPTGAGLGGGSSNAAAALHLCNRIWDMELSEADLLPVAARLGADVPFFLYGGCYFGAGKGEILSPAPSPYPFHIVIGTPQCRVETGWAYGQLDPARKREWARFKALYFTYFEDWEFYQVLRNDFDAPMRRHFPEIDTLANRMQDASPVKTLLSGSGASVFSLFRERPAAEKCLEEIRASCRFACLAGFSV